MIKRFIITLFFITTSLATAQTIGGSFMVGSPQGEFRSYVDRLGYGFQLHGTLWAPSPQRPLTIGLDFPEYI